MTPEEESYMKIIMPDIPVANPNGPIVAKAIELRNIGYLRKISTQVNCPACKGESMSVVRLETVTCLQKLLKYTNMCKTWDSRCDINHYCGICGCYLGRFVPIDCYEKCLSKRARRLAANDAMIPRPEAKDCFKKLQEASQRISENMEKEREERKKMEEQLTREENTNNN